MEASHASFERVNLKGRNIGAAMWVPGHGGTCTSGESHDCCCSIKIYINNNVQGVNNSLLHGSEVTMRDPGVSLFFGEHVKVDRGSFGSNKKRNLGFCLKFLFVIFSLFLLLSLL
jgi:hypothetical protein